ncbi:MAG: thioredoxin [Candidatus Beckwithbacteria bacterium]|nr:thioredoxin [Candidatus Beckwithbacteria bacterium]
MAVLQLTDKDFEEKVVKNQVPALVDFYADWCGPCKLAAPVIEELSEEYKDKLTVGKMNVDENKVITGKYGIMSIPTMIVFKGGQEVERVSGFAGKEGVVKLINKILGE